MSISNQEYSSYHHGDLRNALIKAGLDLLNEAGIEGLSLRKLARQVGVSHNAPYMHFKDKEGLLAAIAAEGFMLLQDDVRNASSASGLPWRDQFSATAHAYVQFTLTHPAHMQVMFRDYDSNIYPDTSQAAEQAFELLKHIMVDGQQQGYLKSGSSYKHAALVWSLLHGVATILAADKMPTSVTDDVDTDQLVQMFLDQIYEGLQARS